jgi:hypothetical protein
MRSAPHCTEVPLAPRGMADSEQAPTNSNTRCKPCVHKGGTSTYQSTPLMLEAGVRSTLQAAVPLVALASVAQRLPAPPQSNTPFFLWFCLPGVQLHAALCSRQTSGRSASCTVTLYRTVWPIQQSCSAWLHPPPTAGTWAGAPDWHASPVLPGSSLPACGNTPVPAVGHCHTQLRHQHTLLQTDTCVVHDQRMGWASAALASAFPPLTTQ